MAHTCPDCDCLCHCGGDIDDLDFGQSLTCAHYKSPDCDGYEGGDDEEEWDEDDYDDEGLTTNYP